MARFVSPTKWRKMAAAVWKTDLGEDLPEVAILRMSDEEFRKFHSSARYAKAYIDKHHYLKRKLIKFRFVSVTWQRKHGGHWSLLLVHTPLSTGTVIAWQEP
jgi:hypothetical protein